MTYECALRSWLSGSVRRRRRREFRSTPIVGLRLASESCAVSGAAGTGAISRRGPRRKIVNNPTGEGAEREGGRAPEGTPEGKCVGDGCLEREREERGKDSVRVRKSAYTYARYAP